MVCRRPQLCDVKAQLKAYEVDILQKQKIKLEALAKEYESRVTRLKKIITARRGYIKALQMDIQKYNKKNEELYAKINTRLENHSNLIKPWVTKSDLDEINWSEREEVDNLKD